MESGMEKMLSNKKENGIDKLLYIVITIYIFYTFWFQYAVVSVYWLLPFLGIIMLALSIVKIKALEFYRYLLNTFFFLLVLYISGMLFSENRGMCLSSFYDTLPKALPMFAIYSYIGTEKARLKKILVSIEIATVLMSIGLLVIGQVSSTGAIVLGDLNSNKFSCYLFVGLFADLYLLIECKDKLNKWCTYFAIAISLIAQIYAASRRGVIVFVFMLMMYIHTIMYVKFKGKPIYRIATAIATVLSVSVLVFLFYDKFDNLVFFQRLFDNKTIGDQLRVEYQATAKKIFFESPIIGRGANAVAIREGMYSHSLFYELLATSGILGTMLIVIPFITNFLHFWKISKYDFDYRFQMQLRIVAWFIIGFFLSGVAVVYIYDPDFYILLGLIASFCNIIDASGYSKRLRIMMGKARLN